MLTMKITPYQSEMSSGLTPSMPNTPPNESAVRIGTKIGTVSSRMPTQSRNMPSTNRITIISSRMP